MKNSTSLAYLLLSLTVVSQAATADSVPVAEQETEAEIQDIGPSADRDTDEITADQLNAEFMRVKILLAERAFASKDNQVFLNRLIHPEVKKATLARIEEAIERGVQLFVIDAPLLFEAGVDAITDSVLVISAENFYRQGRVEKRSQIESDDFSRRDNLQLSIEEKISRADHVIYNNGSLDELKLKVDEMYLLLKL